MVTRETDALPPPFFYTYTDFFLNCFGHYLAYNQLEVGSNVSYRHFDTLVNG